MCVFFFFFIWISFRCYYIIYIIIVYSSLSSSGFIRRRHVFVLHAVQYYYYIQMWILIRPEEIVPIGYVMHAIHHDWQSKISMIHKIPVNQRIFIRFLVFYFFHMVKKMEKESCFSSYVRFSYQLQDSNFYFKSLCLPVN